MIRPAAPEDVPELVAMVHELAEFEQARDECHLTPAQLHASLFGPAPAVFCHVAEQDGKAAGMALWFLTYSTWEGTHGVYLEDLYVRPAARGTGAGKALLAALAAHCVAHGYRRLEWAVLDWNPARAFYEHLGAAHKRDWLPYRLTGAPLEALAAAAGASTS
ncbi:GNAT family N-acetyltransferase [Dactylosporangium matsuzakiense]|uniref:N-acetyltransferase n=1 Tax=Dactylosporangium matsuzakiense TaxID=53360 RepID=A0A9W6KG77_9ACTN|nr:GNAT family N-acetyltransferase [Dactylosporangium matsuzakiense]UWZ46016.1 GNAT family N-acetyltransferase [Dactylosporangium matsuzakiense]GLL00135.1 N-acetyltransferase [Dactylosporangium matsuzakiense]